MVEYAIIDFENRKLAVVYESRVKEDAEKALIRYQDGSCDIYSESGKKLYRIICQENIMTSNAMDIKKD